jgi:hypothetical protein
MGMVMRCRQSWQDGVVFGAGVLVRLWNAQSPAATFCDQQHLEYADRQWGSFRACKPHR